MAMDITFGTTIWPRILPFVNYIWLYMGFSTVLPFEHNYVTGV